MPRRLYTERTIKTRATKSTLGQTVIICQVGFPKFWDSEDTLLFFRQMGALYDTEEEKDSPFVNKGVGVHLKHLAAHKYI
jgi:hypothetical protein